MPPEVLALIGACSGGVQPALMTTIVSVESGGDPYAIGVVEGVLERQPVSLDEAVSTAGMLAETGWNFSVGLAQVNVHNWEAYELTAETALDPCTNVRTGAAILTACHDRAKDALPGQGELQIISAVSCYYTGTFTGGLAEEPELGSSYVERWLQTLADLQEDGVIEVSGADPAFDPSDTATIVPEDGELPIGSRPAEQN